MSDIVPHPPSAPRPLILPQVKVLVDVQKWSIIAASAAAAVAAAALAAATLLGRGRGGARGR